MNLSDLLLPELDSEALKTSATLKRVPQERTEFAPHPKSMSLGKLAAHVAQLGGFGVRILTAPGLDFATAGMKPLVFESPEQVVEAFAAGIAASRKALAKVDEASWSEPWALSHGAKILFESTRFGAYRGMFVNHIVHHRAQLGVYLRLVGMPVPAVYGPSADEF